jgi:hypothetical protein
MGNIRILKKDIDRQVFEIISDCFVFTGLHPDNKTDKVAAIIEDAVSLRNDLVSRTNSTIEKNNPKSVKAHFRAIKADLAEGTDKLCRRLSDISTKQKK